MDECYTLEFVHLRSYSKPILRSIKLRDFSFIVMVQILSFNLCNFFLIILIFLKKRDWLGLVIVYVSCGLNMSSNGPILQPKIQLFIHLGLSWLKSLILGTGMTFLLGSTEFYRQNIFFKACSSRLVFIWGASW